MRTCSTFSKARKTLDYVLRFVNNTRMKAKNTDPILPKELTESELRLFKWSQQTIDVDKLDKKLIRSKDEHGLLRAHGRVENILRMLPDEMRNPIILPKSYRLVEPLLVHTRLNEHTAVTRASLTNQESDSGLWEYVTWRNI